jgi:hypothetical protein
MSAATATQPAVLRMIAVDAGQPDLHTTLVIDEFHRWHNQPDSMLSPTSITWNDPITVTGHAA